jgi:hypothetical protein
LLDEKVAFNLLVTAEITACQFYDFRHRELFQIMERIHNAGTMRISSRSHSVCRSFQWAGPDPTQAEPEFDHNAWQRQLTEGSNRELEDDLIDLCATPLPRTEAVRKLIEKGHSRATAYCIVQRALKEGLVRLEGDNLHPMEPA